MPCTDHTYATIAGRALHLDLYRPKEGVSIKRTAVILLHGGGWRLGDRATMRPYADSLSAAGYVAVAAEYRFVGEAPWPAQLQDVQAAIRWTRENAADLGIDASRIALQGYSAGGHLALMAGALADAGLPGSGPKGERVAAVVCFYAPAGLAVGARPQGFSPAERLLGEAATAELAAAASPVGLIDADFPPTFLLHGTADITVDAAASRCLYDALLQAGVAADLHLYHGHAHEFCRLPSMLGPVQAEVIGFLERTVVDPEHYRRESLQLNPFATP